MNMPMDRMREAFTLPDPPAPSPFVAPAPEPEPAPRASRSAKASAATPRKQSDAPAPAAGGVVDPMQWWGALTQQFTELAATALKDTGSNVDAARQLAGQAVKSAAAAAMPAKTAGARKRSR